MHPAPALCDRKRKKYYRTRAQGGNASLLARACPPARYQNISVNNVSQAVGQLVTCHGVTSEKRMRDLHRFAC